MKEGWKYKTLDELCTKHNGLWKGKKEPFVNVGVIRNANFTKDFTLDFSNIEYLDVEEKQYKSRKLEKGDLIIEKSGGSEKQPVGRAVLFLKEDGEYSFSNFTSILRIRDKNEIDYFFLFYVLLFIYRRGDTRSMQKAATGIHNIEFEKYLAIPIPLPPLPEQQRVVEQLDSSFVKIDALKANAEKMVEEAKALFAAALREAMKPKEGWEEKKLGEVASLCLGKMLDKNKNAGTPMPYLRNANVQWGSFTLSDLQLMKFENEEVERYSICKGDIVMCEGGEPGRCAVWNEEKPILFQKALHRIRPKEFLSSYFMFYQLSKIIRFGEIRHKYTGATILHLTGQVLRTVNVSYPPLPEQTRIVSTLDTLSAQVRQLEANFKKVSEECDALKQAILRETFE